MAQLTSIRGLVLERPQMSARFTKDRVRPIHAPRRRRAAVLLAVAAPALCALALSPPANAQVTAGAPVFAFANATGNEPPRQEVALPTVHSQGFSSPVTIVRRDEVGMFEVHIPGVATEQPFSDPDQEGVVHVKATGALGGSCHTFPEPHDDRRGGLLVVVDCFDNFGLTRVNRPFSVSYTRGGSDAGSLVSTQAIRLKVPGSQDFFASSGELTIDGALQDFRDPDTRVGMRRKGVGAYQFETVALSGAGPSSVQVSPMLEAFPKAGQLGAVCGVLKIATVDSGTTPVQKLTRTDVQCRGPAGFGPVDVPVAFSFAKGINPLGSSRLTTAYVNVPKTTAPSTALPAGRFVNRALGSPAGGVTLLRTSPGRYEVLLEGQQVHLPGEALAATARGSTADCQITRSIQDASAKAQRIGVACSSAPALQPVDTAFDLQYTTMRLAIGRLRLTPTTLHARAGRTTHLKLGWTHPKAWKQLRTLSLRVTRGADTVGKITIKPGSGRLRGHGAVKLLARDSRVSHRGKTVSARLAIRLARTLAGENLSVDVTATDRHGRRQLEPHAGRIHVTN
jgi:hypothetical protein